MNEPAYSDEAVAVYLGDCLDLLADMPPDSIDSVVTDPPYELSFMGKKWDGTGVASQTDTWRACLRVLKPGGYLLAFGGTRTWHRLACAVEDAGFEIRDSIAWLYGSGFPKSLDVSKAITATQRHGGANSVSLRRSAMGEAYTPSGKQGNRDGAGGSKMAGDGMLPVALTDDAQAWAGWGTALKPAHEPIVVARKPLSGTVAANVLAHGTGALNIDGCRIGTADTLGRTNNGREHYDPSSYTLASVERTTFDRSDQAGGRWPANVVLDEHAAAALDEQSGTSSAGQPRPDRGRGGIWQPSADGIPAGPQYGYTGGASRFFYCAKAPTKERPVGPDGTKHPTVKPLTLMRWLVRLVTPPGGLVLDPFAGSGTTGEAAILEGLRATLIEQEPDYLPMIVSRLSATDHPIF